jgi:hypothetical protein
MRSTLVIFLSISLGSSLLFAAILPGSFVKTFSVLLALHVAASFIGLGNFILGKWVSGLPWSDRAILKRAFFHVANAGLTGAWAWYVYRADFLGVWFGAFLIVGVVGALGSMADLTGQFQAGYNAVVNDLKSGHYPRVRE